MKPVALGFLIAALSVANFAWGADVKVGRLKPDSVIIFTSNMAGGKDAGGLPIAPEELYATSLDGKDVVRLTFSGYSHNHFEVSPDRTMIAANRFSRGDTNHDGRYDIRDFKQLWIIDMARGKEWKIAEGMDAGIGGVAWSPDSKYVYFSSATDQAHPNNGLDIYRVGTAPGDKPVALTSNLNKLLGRSDPHKFITDVGVSRDGQWMVTTYITGTPGNTLTSGGKNPPRRKSQIALIRVDGTAARLLTDGGTLSPQMRGIFPVGDFDPDFSPDGKSVAFARITDRGYVHVGNVNGKLSTHDIYRINVDGTGLKDLENPPNQPDADAIPAWSFSDDCKILFSVWTDRQKNPYPGYFNSDGSHKTIVKLPGPAHHVQWIPTGAPAPAQCP